MDEGTTRMKDHRPSPETPAELERDIEVVRNDLGMVAGELDRRRHELFDVRRQLTRHPLAIALIAGAALGIAAAGIALARSRRRRYHDVGERFGRVREAIQRMSRHPERAARPTPSAGRRIATAGGTAAASVLARQLTQRLLNR
jgi:hypothetical protein